MFSHLDLHLQFDILIAIIFYNQISPLPLSEEGSTGEYLYPIIYKYLFYLNVATKQWAGDNQSS